MVWKILLIPPLGQIVKYNQKQRNDGYGAFQNSWQIGEAVSLTWEDGREKLVHICGRNVFRKKAYVYFLLGMLLLMVFGIGTVKIFGHQEYITEVENYRKEWK